MMTDASLTHTPERFYRPGGPSCPTCYAPALRGMSVHFNTCPMLIAAQRYEPEPRPARLPSMGQTMTIIAVSYLFGLFTGWVMSWP